MNEWYWEEKEEDMYLFSCSSKWFVLMNSDKYDDDNDHKYYNYYEHGDYNDK